MAAASFGRLKQDVALQTCLNVTLMDVYNGQFFQLANPNPYFF